MTAEQIFELAQKLKYQHMYSSVPAKEFGLQPSDEIIYDVVDLQHDKHGRVKLHFTTEFAREADPPFEWVLEIDDFDGEHYLWLADGKFVRAERKEFFDVDEPELAKVETRLRSFLA